MLDKLCKVITINSTQFYHVNETLSGQNCEQFLTCKSVNDDDNLYRTSNGLICTRCARLRVSKRVVLRARDVFFLFVLCAS